MGAGLLANAVGQSIHVWLTHCIREQARSHIDLLHMKHWCRPSLAKRPLSYSKTAARGRRLVHCASFYAAGAGSAATEGFGSEDRNAMINAATYGSDCTSSITTQKRMSLLGRPCTR